MDCKDYRAEIEESDFGVELSIGVQTHINGCSACREFYHERVALRQMLNRLERVGVPSDFDFRLRARLAAAENAERQSFPRQRFAWGFASVAFAACLVLMIAVTVRLSRTGKVDSVSIAPPSAPQTISNPLPQIAKEQNGSNNSPAETKGLEIAHRPLLEEANNETKNRKGPKRINAKVRSQPRQNSREIDENSFSVKEAPVLNIASAIPVPVSISSQPVRVVLKGERGPRKIRIEPVSFGAQGFVSRLAKPEQTASATEGVW